MQLLSVPPQQKLPKHNNSVLQLEAVKSKPSTVSMLGRFGGCPPSRPRLRSVSAVEDSPRILSQALGYPWRTGGRSCWGPGWWCLGYGQVRLSWGTTGGNYLRWSCSHAMAHTGQTLQPKKVKILFYHPSDWTTLAKPNLGFSELLRFPILVTITSTGSYCWTRSTATSPQSQATGNSVSDHLQDNCPLLMIFISLLRNGRIQY